MFSREVPSAASGWPSIRQNRINGDIEVTADNYITPKAMMRMQSIAQFIFALAVFALVVGGLMVVSGDPALVPQGVLLAAGGSYVAFSTRKSRHEKLARKFFGKTLKIFVNERQIRATGGAERNINIPIQPGLPLKLGLMANPEAQHLAAEMFGTNDLNQRKKLQKRVVILQQSQQCVLQSESSIVTIATVYNDIDARRILNGVQIALEMVFQPADAPHMAEAVVAE